MDISGLQFLDWDSGHFRIEILRTGTVDISELSYLGLR